MKIKILAIIVAVLAIIYIALSFIPAKDICSVCNEEKAGFEYMVPDFAAIINHSENTKSLQFYCNDCYDQTNDTYKQMMDRKHHENLRTIISYSIDIAFFFLSLAFIDDYGKIKKENKELKNLIPDRD